MSKTETTTQTRTSRRELQRALRRADLTREEELVLRMRHGIPASESTPLEYRGQSHPELAAKLALIEADAVAAMRPRSAQTEDPQLKSDIISKLKNL